MIGVVDYGLGNLFSLENALRFLGGDFRRVSRPEDLSCFDKLILPGVGAFPRAVAALRETGMFEALKRAEQPLFGICLGFQLLFTSGEEFSLTEGLDLIPGRVVRLEGPVKIPHIGWNSLHLCRPEHPLLEGIREGDFVYYVHSYRAVTAPEFELAVSDYGQTVCGLAGKGRVSGSQFHPEKSGDVGLTLLKNFLEKRF